MPRPSGVVDTTPVAPPDYGDVDPAGRGGGDAAAIGRCITLLSETSAGALYYERTAYHERTAEQLFFAITSPIDLLIN